jgi:hypothetical protein
MKELVTDVTVTISYSIVGVWAGTHMEEKIVFSLDDYRLKTL